MREIKIPVDSLKHPRVVIRWPMAKSFIPNSTFISTFLHNGWINTRCCSFFREFHLTYFEQTWSEDMLSHKYDKKDWRKNAKENFQFWSHNVNINGQEKSGFETDAGMLRKQNWWQRKRERCLTGFLKEKEKKREERLSSRIWTSHWKRRQSCCSSR